MHREGLFHGERASYLKGKANPGDSTKRKIVLFLECIPKKKCPEAKHYVLCKKHWDTHNSHTMSDCCKCKKDDTPKKNFGWNQLLCFSSEKKRTQSYAQLLDKLAKLKAHKKLKIGQ